MCGICGKVYYDSQRPVEPDILVAMTDAIVKRGPDSNGFYLKGNVGLGSRRLSIIDVEGGRMPISNEDGTVWIVYNGELYNFLELRQRLERAGHQFSTHTDTETIVHLYEDEGDNFVKYINGMFAVAIWDERRQRLILARDHVGIKPLYYAQLNDRLVFGSEIKAILPDGMARQVDPVGLHNYLSLNYVPGPESLFSGIKKLLPGHILTYENTTKKINVEQYWDYPTPDPQRVKQQATRELEDELLHLLRQIVKDQMISDVPLGAFLSGGIDSSLVVALMSEASNQPVRTFSAGFEEESYSELPFAKIVANHYKTDHHEVILKPKAHDIVAAISDYFDEPFADSSAVGVYAISEMAAKHLKVILSGDGGDEFFGGYYTYQADKIAHYYRKLPKFIGGGLIPKLANLVPTSDEKVSFDFKLKRFMAGGALAPLPAHFEWKAFFSEEMKHRLYNPAYLRQHAASLNPSVTFMQQIFDGYPSDDMLNRLLYVDCKVQLPDDMLTKVDRVSMAHSLEVRVPFLDLRLVEFMTRLPSHLKVRGLTLKYLLKRIATRVLPNEILTRPKAGFHVPVARWIKTDLKDLVGDHLSVQQVTRQGFFDSAMVQQILQAHWQGRQNHSHNIWNLLMFSLWYERYVV